MVRHVLGASCSSSKIKNFTDLYTFCKANFNGKENYNIKNEMTQHDIILFTILYDMVTKMRV